MYTDIVGYTTMMEKNEAATLQILKVHNQILDGIIQRHNGNTIKTIGDAYLVKFQSSDSAAQCAIAIQKAILQQDFQKTFDTDVKVRIGIHQGDVLETEDDIHGHHVNMSQRYQSIATPGCVVVSLSVYETIKHKHFVFDGPKSKHVKGISEPQTFYEIIVPPFEQPTSKMSTVKIDKSKLPPVRPLPVKHRMPYASLASRFVGRISELWELHDLLNKAETVGSPQIAIIVGTGGLGKSQIAVEYLHRFGAEYPGGVFWVDARQGRDGMIDQIADTNEIDGTLKEEDRVQALWKKKSQAERILMVFDNFSKDEPLSSWLPPNGDIHVLVTTLRHDLTNYEILSLPFLTLDEGMRLLNSGKRKFELDAKDLVGALGGLPLVLEIARHYLNLRTDIEVKDILAQFRQAGTIGTLRAFSKTYRDLLPTGHEKEIALTIQLSLNQVSDVGKDILQAMSLLAPAPVPRRLLYRIFENDFNDDVKTKIDDGISELVNDFSLLELDGENDPKAHILILGFVKETIEQDSKRNIDVSKAVEQEMARVNDLSDIETFRDLEKVLLHAQILIEENLYKYDLLSSLFTDIAKHHRNLGRYRLSEKFVRESVKVTKENNEPDRPSIGASQSNLALVLMDLGEFGEARKLLEEVLDMDKKNYPVDHPSIAITQSNLAIVLQELGEFQIARTLLEEALKSNKKNYESGHPSIATSQSNLATVLHDMGKLEEAKELHEEALISSERSYEPGHPSIATSQSNLATVLHDMGKLEEAKELLEKALKTNENNFEPGHPSIAISKSNLATVLHGLGKLKEAKELLEEALASDMDNYETGHPSIALRKSLLATVMADLGKLDDAKNLLGEAVHSLCSKLGPNHPSSRIATKNLEIVIKKIAER